MWAFLVGLVAIAAILCFGKASHTIAYPVTLLDGMSTRDQRRARRTMRANKKALERARRRFNGGHGSGAETHLRRPGTNGSRGAVR